MTTTIDRWAGLSEVIRGAVYHWEGRIARVTGKHPTTEGGYVTLRDPQTYAPLGNYPASQLGERAEEK